MLLKVVSYNIHKGFSLKPFDFVLQEIKRSIQMVDADIVFLQEVLGHHKKHSPDLAQFEFLADSVWPHFSYGKNSVYTRGHHGNAILSKYPIDFVENRDISKHRFEQRGILHAVAKLKPTETPLHLYCLHFGLFEKDRIAQTQDLCAMIEQRSGDEAVLVAGDFNDWRKRVTEPLLKVNLKDCFHEKNKQFAKTFPSFFPSLALDRIYARKLNVVECRVLTGEVWQNLSDHCPLYAEVSL